MTRAVTIDCLANEILITILEYAIDHETPFWIGNCLQLPRFRYRIPGISRLELDVKQDVHRNDWLMINTTCRRFREVGKGIFFRTKTFVMSLEMHERLKTGTSWLELSDRKREEALCRYKCSERKAIRLNGKTGGKSHNSRKRWCALSAQDRKFAISYIRHVVFSDAVYYCLEDVWKFTRPVPKLDPELLSTFPALRRCDFIIEKGEHGDETRGYELHLSGDQDGDDNPQGKWYVDKGFSGQLRLTAAKLEELLKSIGIGGNLRIGLCVHDDHNEPLVRLGVVRLLLRDIRRMVEDEVSKSVHTI